MRIYLASRYSRNAEMRQVRDRLQSIGHEVTSRWIDNHGGELEESFTPERLGAEPEFCSRFAQIDLDDLSRAHCVISFTGNGGKGGRHVEFGYASALEHCPILIIVGERENVFHCLPQVRVVKDVDSLMQLLQSFNDQHQRPREV